MLESEAVGCSYLKDGGGGLKKLKTLFSEKHVAIILPPRHVKTSSPAVAAAGADHVLIITGKANVGDVSRVTKVTLVFGLVKDHKCW